MIIALAASLKALIFLEAKTTSAPASARATAHPQPIPDEAPVTNALRPSSLNEGVLGKSIIYCAPC
jgi:hypothetical protein